MTTDRALEDEYQATRAAGVDRSVLCHAPFTSLNFDQLGQARVCCYNWRDVLGTYPEMSVAEMWSGARAIALRRAFHAGAEPGGCELCFDQLRARNFAGTLMKGFDSVSGGVPARLDAVAPRSMEFELSNTCNLECIQCQGKWSSAIRRNRERLPPLRSPYDADFVDQLTPFLSGLTQAKFLGGEPLLIALYHRIWERLRELNPACEISITTNGTVIPDAVWEVLQDLRCHICLSLDSVEPETYARIRKNGSLDVVLGNLQRWQRYTKRQGTSLSIAVCPMTHNWRELPAIARFCEDRGIRLYVNSVFRPYSASLAGLSAEVLGDVVEHLSREVPARAVSGLEENARQWSGLLSQLRAWRATKLELRASDDTADRFRQAVRCHAPENPVGGLAAWECVAGALARRYAVTASGPDRIGADLRRRLLQITPLSVHEGEQCAPPEVLLPVLLIGCRTGVLLGADRVPAGGVARLDDEMMSLAAYMRTEHGGPTGPRQTFRGSVRRTWVLIQNGRWDEIDVWLSDVLGARDSAVFVSDSLRELTADGRCSARCSQFLEALIRESTGGAVAEMERAEGVTTIRTMADLEALLEAMARFRRRRAEADDVVQMERRVSDVRRTIAAAAAVDRVAALQQLETTGVFKAYTFLATAPEPEFVAAMARFEG